MKNIVPFLFILIISCKPSFIVSQQINQKAISCPENSECSFELIPNKSIEFKTDDFGILYPIITDGEKTLLKYTFKKNPIKNTQDSNYSEIIYAELDTKFTEVTLENEDLQKVKLYFGRFCYCKGQTGYYPIKNGTFKILKAGKNTVNFNLNFEIKEVPQIISIINETISLQSN
tara:strand:- start:437 stop:958 length:522 start_codon:yes stop_codon:yes gene_type:complete